jgi:RNA polymerase sigma-70 factor (ECF subfamily)
MGIRKHGGVADMDGYPLEIRESGSVLTGTRLKMETAVPRSELADNDLVSQALKGHISAFKELVERYQRRAYHFALGMVHNSDDACDLSQEAFVRVHKHLKRFDRNYPFKVWLFHILSNLCKNHIRQRKTREGVVISTDDERTLTIPDVRSPEKELDKVELQAQVWGAIEQLPDKFKEIIILSHFQEMSYEQMAQVLEIPRGSVMSRLYYARVKLREILESMGVEI